MNSAWLALLLPLALPQGLVLEAMGLRRIEDPGASTELLCEGPDGAAYALPRTRLTVRAEIHGFVARTVVTQTFHNPTDAWLEARYLYPLPEAGAVESFEMRVGDRWIRGEIQRKAEARRTFESTRNRGLSTALLEQLRANLFDTRVANIPPGAELRARITVREVLDFRDDAFTYRFPIPVTPRFRPDAEVAEALSATDWGEVRPVVDVQVCAQPGVEAKIVSEGAEQWNGDERTCFRSREGGRDFVLRWSPATREAAQTVAFVESFAGEAYAALMLFPPQPARATTIPREVVFVLDTSGSMGGPSMPQAQAAVIDAIDRLGDHDCFDVIDFDDDAHPLWGECQPATVENRRAARRHVRSLRADGGTHMSPALHEALGRPAPDDRDYLRQVVFVTDGAVGREPELLEQIQRELGDARLFTVGIGAAPNAAFMRDAARFGGGTFTFIGSPLEVEAQMGQLFSELSHPTVRDLKVSWGVEADVVNARPELYAGQPLMVLAKLPRPPPGPVQVRGQTAGAPWTAVVPTHRGVRALHALWARGRVTELEDAHRLGGPAALESTIAKLGLKHGLMTRFTSFVAVDDGPRRPDGSRLDAVRVATPTPVGAATLPRGGTPSALLLLASLLLGVGGLSWRGRHC